MSEIVTNKQGGKQSAITGKMTEVPPIALLAISEVMGKGSEVYPRETDGSPNWHRIDSKSNLDHALEHAARFMEVCNRVPGSGLDALAFEELSHFAARAMMALEMYIKEVSWLRERFRLDIAGAIIDENEGAEDSEQQEYPRLAARAIPLFYLAHPFDSRNIIRGVQKTWEREFGIKFLNPFFNIVRDDVKEIDEGRAGRYEKLNPVELVARDLAAVQQCHGMLAFVTGDLSYGTIMEIVYARQMGKPVYIVVLNGHQDHPWLRVHATRVFAGYGDVEEWLRENFQKN
jgi:nucleoside 2-deoxyribosyltransferase